ncbi:MULTISPECIES: helix-turn-helix transcriptional regulator [unclassified Fusibacter]|uniref:helix-turn-helix domain-containing protein n=1 Tax=unclassified Fusibacter TaxID=2624464 RepID=UPI0013E91485|nr:MULTISPECIES: helix-turn-helix transcriptional regulator [unclassified Fusibacter]MCK8058642.1 helix-turn-helix domain-containing protein [Fusibacter sp. A2]NPE21717.1 helix-turn-helix transcriptional regulator [Fusibacter sp. A1]
MNRVAEEIKQARIKAGLSEKELAKKCGLAVSYIIQVESGKKIVKEEIAEKILTACGKELSFVKVEKEPEPEPVKVVVEQVKAPTKSVSPNAQWSDALAGVIRNYPILRGKKVVGEEQLVIAGKKFDGFHPDDIVFFEAMEDDKNFRLLNRDVMMVGITESVVNNQPYLIEYYGKQMVRRLRKENNKGLVIIPGLNGGSQESVSQNDIKVIGRILKVSFKI